MRDYLLRIIPAAVIVVLLIVMYQDVAQGFEQVETWCHSYNGSLVADRQLQCEFPNGTVRPIPEHVYQS